MNYNKLANEVSAEIKKGANFHQACAEVLRDFGINRNWDKHFSIIGRALGELPKKKVFRPAAPARLVSQKEAAEMIEQQRQMLADSDD